MGQLEELQDGLVRKIRTVALGEHPRCLAMTRKENLGGESCGGKGARGGEWSDLLMTQARFV